MGPAALEDLAEEGHQLPARILDWRQLAKLKSTYADALPSFVDPRTKRVHTSYALAATTTGRLRSQARQTHVKQLSLRPHASFAKVLASRGAIRKRSAQRRKSMWSTGSPR